MELVPTNHNGGEGEQAGPQEVWGEVNRDMVGFGKDREPRNKKKRREIKLDFE